MGRPLWEIAKVVGKAVWETPKVLSLRRGPKEKTAVVLEGSQNFCSDRLIYGEASMGNT